MSRPHTRSAFRRRIVLLTLIHLALPAAAAAQGPAPAHGTAGAVRAAATAAPISDVRYEVTANAAAARSRTLRVTMSFATTGGESVVLSLPAWTPGAYEISDFAKWVQNFRATDERGRSLAWDKVDQDSWRVRPSPGGRGRVTIAFDYRADSLDNAMSWTRPDFVLFNGTNVFLYPEGQSLDFPATVTVRPEAGWLVATGMQSSAAAPAANDVKGGAADRSFTSSNYHDLVDMPFFVGRFDIDSVRVPMPAAGGDRWVRLATYPAGSVSGARRATALRWLERVVPPQGAVFGETPWQTYTVMQIADSAYGGLSGLEHQNSHVDIITPLALDAPILSSLYAHEIFHSWNVKRLRPAELVPYRYDARQPTPLLWVSEGVTDYYADLSLVRGDLAGLPEFLKLTEGKIEEVAAAPPTALEDASLSTWVHPTDGSGYLYYPKGSLVGLLLDVMIRDASDNRRSLDDVMRELYAATFKRGQGFTNEQWWAAVKRAAGRDAAPNGPKGPTLTFDDFYRRYIDGRDELPYASVLPLAGFRFVADTLREPRLGVGTLADSAGALMVTFLEPAGALAAAGVVEGDRLVSVGDVAANDENFGTHFRTKYAKSAPGTRVPVVVRRDGQPVTLSAALAFVPRVQRRVVLADRPSAKAIRVRGGILSGTTDK